VLPDGLVYRRDLLSVDEERALLDILDALRFDPIVIRGQAAKRTARHYGPGYDYGTRKPKPGEPLPDWLLPLRARAADLAGHDEEELVEALVQRYPAGSTIGRHRDAPAFDTVTGVSLLGAARLRFQRGKGERREVAELVLEPRSGYVLAGEARRSWEHSIPPAKGDRYSMTFRTLR
jgi:DNA oxidative demethylase